MLKGTKGGPEREQLGFSDPKLESQRVFFRRGVSSGSGFGETKELSKTFSISSRQACRSRSFLWSSRLIKLFMVQKIAWRGFFALERMAGFLLIWYETDIDTLRADIQGFQEDVFFLLDR